MSTREKIRVGLDIILIMLCLYLAVTFALDWIDHDFPLFRHGGLPGGKKTLLPWLWLSIGTFLVGLVAVADAYIYLSQRDKSRVKR